MEMVVVGGTFGASWAAEFIGCSPKVVKAFIGTLCHDDRRSKDEERRW